jgi:hypothetical protein
MVATKQTSGGATVRGVPRRAEDVLDQIEAGAKARLREDLSALWSESGAAPVASFLRRRPQLALVAAAAVSVAAAPFLARLLGSPARARRLVGLAAPFVKDALGRKAPLPPQD